MAATSKWYFLLFELKQRLHHMRITTAHRKSQFTEGERTWDMKAFASGGGCFKICSVNEARFCQTAISGIVFPVQVSAALQQQRGSYFCRA